MCTYTRRFRACTEEDSRMHNYAFCTSWAPRSDGCIMGISRELLARSSKALCQRAAASKLLPTAAPVEKSCCSVALLSQAAAKSCVHGIQLVAVVLGSSREHACGQQSRRYYTSACIMVHPCACAYVAEHQYSIDRVGDVHISGQEHSRWLAQSSPHSRDNTLVLIDQEWSQPVL